MFHNQKTGKTIVLPEDIFTHVMPHITSIEQATAMMGNLSRTCTQLYSLFHGPLSTFSQLILLQAVIDGNSVIVRKLLNSKPTLLIEPVPSNILIQSQLTLQTYHAENVMSMAVKRKQIKMIELLLSYVNQLPQTNATTKTITEALSAWKHYDLQKYTRGMDGIYPSEYKYLNLMLVNDDDEIVIPQNYVTYVQSLVNVLRLETFANSNLLNLSVKSEEALADLFKTLCPTEAINLNNGLDVELLLLAAYKAYGDNFDSFNTNQREVFSIRVIGLIQSKLPPEMAELFCGKLNFIFEAIQNNKAPTISAQASKYQLQNGQQFYSTSLSQRKGLGFEFVCDHFGHQKFGDYLSIGFARTAYSLCVKMMLLKQNKFLLLSAPLQSNQVINQKL